MTNVEFINMTPHEVVLVNSDSKEVLRRFPASGTLARVNSSTKVVGEIDGIPITTTEFSDVYGLPEQKDGTVYIVSLAVAQRATDRDDLLVPNGSVRDEQGRIIGCTSLAMV